MTARVISELYYKLEITIYRLNSERNCVKFISSEIQKILVVLGVVAFIEFTIYLDVLSEKLYLRKGISVHNALFRAKKVRI